MNSIKGLNTIDHTRFKSLTVDETSKPQTTQRPPPPTNDQSSFDAGGAPNGPPPFLDAAADALGLSADDLDEKLKSGESLESIAQSQGVSIDSLTAAIATDFKTTHADATDAQAQAVAERSVKGHKGHHQPPSLDALADKLGLSTDDLATQLQAGASIEDIAKAQGVTLDAPKRFRINDMRIQQLEP